MNNTHGQVYFAIKTEGEKLSLAFFNKYLTIQPTKFQKQFENGNTPVCTIWEFSSGDLINAMYFEEIEKLIATLSKHEDELIKLKHENPEVEFVLEVVIYLGDESPSLHFSRKTIEFINHVGGIIDCDIYNN